MNGGRNHPTTSLTSFPVISSVIEIPDDMWEEAPASSAGVNQYEALEDIYLHEISIRTRRSSPEWGIDVLEVDEGHGQAGEPVMSDVGGTMNRGKRVCSYFGVMVNCVIDACLILSVKEVGAIYGIRACVAETKFDAQLPPIHFSFVVLLQMQIHGWTLRWPRYHSI